MITIIKAKEGYAIGKDPRPPPLPPGGIPKEFDVIARSRELDNIAKAKDPNPATTILNRIGTTTRNLVIIKNLATVKTLDVAKNRNPGNT